MNYEIKNNYQLHTQLLPILKEGDTLTKTYTNKYGNEKVITFDFSLNEYGRPLLNGRKKFKYESEYITYTMYNNYSNHFEGHKIVSSIFIN